MSLIFSNEAWEEYLYWRRNDKKISEKIEILIKDIQRNGIANGIGKPEPLKNRKEWSRRINNTHRLIYTLDSDKNVVISSCKGHYTK